MSTSQKQFMSIIQLFYLKITEKQTCTSKSLDVDVSSWHGVHQAGIWYNTHK